jgi:hypothetical protein
MGKKKKEKKKIAVALSTESNATAYRDQIGDEIDALHFGQIRQGV